MVSVIQVISGDLAGFMLFLMFSLWKVFGSEVGRGILPGIMGLLQSNLLQSCGRSTTTGSPEVGLG